jgi:hypothetical protein
MSATNRTGGIIVYRARDFFAVARRLKVLIDEEEAGSIPYGEQFEFDVRPGVYTIRVAMDWSKSEPYEVRVDAGDVVELDAGLRWRGPLWWWSLVACFFLPHRMLVVQPFDR